MEKHPSVNETYLKQNPGPFKMSRHFNFRVTSSSSSVLLIYSLCNGLRVKSEELKQGEICPWGA